MFSKNSFRSKMIQVSGSTLVSRILGMIREVLLARFFGQPGVISDAFFTAFKIPNSLRKMFAEGAISASFVPTFVALEKQGKRQEVNSLMSLSFLVLEGILIGLCIAMFIKADWVIRVIVPGWYSHIESFELTGVAGIDSLLSVFFGPGGIPGPQVPYAITYLRILIAFIIFLSSSALLASALQAVGHFFVPAFAPVLLNIVFISALAICMQFGLSVSALCYFLLAGGLLQFLLHLAMYCRLCFAFGPLNKQAWRDFKQVLQKFLPCFLSMSVMEIYFFVDSSLASFLSAGSVTLIYYANRFMGIPLGVFAVALSTVLLPHFASIGVQEPKKMAFYANEAAKLVLWVTLPATLLMCFVSDKIFITLFVSKKFTLFHAAQAAGILQAFLFGLFFFSLNKVLLNMYYALHETKLPLYITVVVGAVNFITSYYIFMPWYGAYGIALATSISGAVQTLLFAYFLRTRFAVGLDWAGFFDFAIRYAVQVALVFLGFVVLYGLIALSILAFTSAFIARLLLQTILFWLWCGPLMALMFYVLYKRRKRWGLAAYFLE